MKSLPVLPVMKAIGAYTATSVSVMATTANPISFEPTSAALNGATPFSTCRKMFSSMTIASSTTSPIASTSARSVSVLTLKPKRYITPNAPTSDTGMVTSGISDARTERRNTKITSATSAIASPMVRSTALIDRSMNTDESYATFTATPSGRSASTLGNSARIACESSSGFAVACLITPSATAGLPLKRTIERSSWAAISTRPTSRMRTG